MPTDVPACPSPGRTSRAQVPLLRSLLLIIPLAASVAHAQYVNTLTGRQFNNMYAANADFVMSQIINDRMFQRRMTSMAQAQPAAANQNAPAPTQAKYKFALSATDFKPAGKRDIPEQLAARSATPEERAQLIEMCRQLQQGIEALPDVRKNNLAMAVAILLGSSLRVVAQKEIGDAESEDLLRVVNDVIASTPDFKKMTNRQRTAAYDAFLITGALIVGLDASAKETNDPALATLARELAVSSLAQFGFKAPAAGPSPQSVPVSNRVTGSVRAATAPATQRSNTHGMLDGIYGGLSSALRLSASGGLTSNPTKVYVTFYPDGKVYRRIPEGGLEGWDRAAAEAESPSLWGSYRPTASGGWEIRWNESTRVGTVYRESAGLRYEDATVFPVATCAGLVLEGTFFQPGAIDLPYPPNTITFSASGGFSDNDLIGDLAYRNIAMPNPRTVGPGEGKYHIGRNTLYLEYDDGRRIPVEIHVRQTEIKTQPIPVIYINGWELVRAQ